MILKGNARGGAKDLAHHLLKDENDHVKLHELRGFISDNLMGALNEAYAQSQGTRCRKFLYSLSLNPPETARVTASDFAKAIDQIEDKLGLINQPRAIVFHEKEGRRHAHVVWSRIDPLEMKAVQLSFDHSKLVEVSRELFLEHGWTMPEGLADPSRSDPRNFTLAEWQQAQRSGRDPRQIKGAIQDAWAISDSRFGFEHALEERGFKLAKGDRRGWVAVDAYGEVYAISRQVGAKAKDVRARLGDEHKARSVDDVKALFETELNKTAERLREEMLAERCDQLSEYRSRKSELVLRQRQQRKALEDKIKNRGEREARERQKRFRKGIAGIWDRLRGHHSKTAKRNRFEAEHAAQRDQSEREDMITKHLSERRRLKVYQLSLHKDYVRERTRLEGSFDRVTRGLER